ncbi:NAD(P)-binding protein [Daedalea quercina L-15889]|uniref:NAD(P)-binding protein n=1 Tax=Daedalea quercina L-15889 TaxID=1314783 RepID=A0A165NBM2_9APHY|nr:NAD(P)-binding protein [Daedalea quercina L-15889]
MSAKTKILLFGATGYIGGSVLNRLLAHPKADTFEITTPVRSPEKAKLLEKLGVRTEVASLNNHDKVESLAANAHIIFNVANSDDLPAMIALLKGLRKAYETTGQLPILIHTSGTGEIAEPVQGKRAAEIVYSDVNIEQMKSIPPTAFHRNVDLAVIGADEQGYARTYIVIPGIVYGIARGPVFEAGISKPISINIPGLIKASLDRKRSGMVGPGKAVWPYVHIDDVADEYIVLFDRILTDPQSAGHGWEGYYFGENGHNSFYELGRAIGQALVDLGLADDAEPTSFTDEELAKYWGSVTAGSYSGTTCRCSADRARAIGWNPKYASADFLANVRPEMEMQWSIAQKKGEIDFSYERSLAELLDSSSAT